MPAVFGLLSCGAAEEAAACEATTGVVDVADEGFAEDEEAAGISYCSGLLRDAPVHTTRSFEGPPPMSG